MGKEGYDLNRSPCHHRTSTQTYSHVIVCVHVRPVQRPRGIISLPEHVFRIKGEATLPQSKSLQEQ